MPIARQVPFLPKWGPGPNQDQGRQDSHHFLKIIERRYRDRQQEQQRGRGVP
jgi:hypothetical protein